MTMTLKCTALVFYRCERRRTMHPVSGPLILFAEGNEKRGRGSCRVCCGHRSARCPLSPILHSVMNWSRPPLESPKNPLNFGHGSVVVELGRVARTLSYAKGAQSSGFEGGSWGWVLFSRSANSWEASE